MEKNLKYWEELWNTIRRINHFSNDESWYKTVEANDYPECWQSSLKEAHSQNRCEYAPHIGCSVKIPSDISWIENSNLQNKIYKDALTWFIATYHIEKLRRSEIVSSEIK